MEIQTHSAPQNDRLNLSFVKGIYVGGGKMARIGRKMVIYESQILRNSLYVPVGGNEEGRRATPASISIFERTAGKCGTWSFSQPKANST